VTRGLKALPHRTGKPGVGGGGGGLSKDLFTSNTTETFDKSVYGFFSIRWKRSKEPVKGGGFGRISTWPLYKLGRRPRCKGGGRPGAWLTELRQGGTQRRRAAVMSAKGGERDRGKRDVPSTVRNSTTPYPSVAVTA